MTLGPFLFGAPLALIGLITLPVIWWILRATPPMPKEVALPSLRLLDGLDPHEETPARTPWWILLLRLAAAALAIFGLSQPVYAPGAPTGAQEGPVLIVIDDGWTSAPRWNELVDAARGHLTTLNRDAPLHLLLTSPRSLPIDPAERLSRQDMSGRIASLEPVSWEYDRLGALERLQISGLRPTQIFWASDGLSPDDGAAFAAALAQYGPLTVYGAPPRGAVAITGITTDASGAQVTLTRHEAGSDGEIFVSALTRDGAAFATANATFAAGENEGTARFALPPAALTRIDRFRLTGAQGAGTTWLWDSANRRQRVGLVSDAEKAQPLLSDLHYVRQALGPFSIIEEGTLADMIAADPDTIILTDIGEVPALEAGDLIRWIEAGGTLIRFAGPRLAAQSGTLTPVMLRRASRALGGALAWDTPQALAPFPNTSPFAGLSPPRDVRVHQQVLARPSPDLDRKTWARLEDGSPLVTADGRGDGALVLFHVTAGPDWSDLPYAGVFVDMLRRAMAAGSGRNVVDDGGVYSPQRVLNGYGRLIQPDDTAAPLEASAVSTTRPSETHPPGLYEGPAGTRALNAATGYLARPITDWPANASLLGDAEVVRLPLAGLALGGALSLLAIDLIVALATAGRLGVLRRPATASILIMVLVGTAGLPMNTAQAQRRNPNDILNTIPREPLRPNVSRSATQELNLTDRAALELRFAYVATGDAKLDQTVEAGLRGLSRVLFLRTSVEPEDPIQVNLETDALELYPFIYMALADAPKSLTPEAASRLNAYMRSGGAVMVDTRAGGTRGATEPDLAALLVGVDVPPLRLAPRDHVITRSFYLLDEFPGRFANDRLWLERGGAGGDGVSGLFVGNADWAGAWAIDERGRPLLSVDGGERQREYARRFGVNFVMYVLTGNYKADQVHLPTLLDRLGEDDGIGPRLPVPDPSEEDTR